MFDNVPFFKRSGKSSMLPDRRRRRPVCRNVDSRHLAYQLALRDCKALLVASLTHVSGAIASVQTFTFTFTLSWNIVTKVFSTNMNRQQRWAMIVLTCQHKLTLSWLEDVWWRQFGAISRRTLGRRCSCLGRLTHKRHGDGGPVQQSKPRRPSAVPAAAALAPGTRAPAETSQRPGKVRVVTVSAG